MESTIRMELEIKFTRGIKNTVQPPKLQFGKVENLGLLDKSHFWSNGSLIIHRGKGVVSVHHSRASLLMVAASVSLLDCESLLLHPIDSSCLYTGNAFYRLLPVCGMSCQWWQPQKWKQGEGKGFWSIKQAWDRKVGWTRVVMHVAPWWVGRGGRWLQTYCFSRLSAWSYLCHPAAGLGWSCFPQIMSTSNLPPKHTNKLEHIFLPVSELRVDMQLVNWRSVRISSDRNATYVCVSELPITHVHSDSLLKFLSSLFDILLRTEVSAKKKMLIHYSSTPLIWA